MKKARSGQYPVQTGRTLISLIFLLSSLFATAGISNAASITGNLGVTGTSAASGGSDLSDATMLSLTNVIATQATGGIGGFVTAGDTGNVNVSPFTFNPSTPVPNLFDIGGWQISLGTTTVDGQTATNLFLSGTGSISGNGFDPTPTNWTLSATPGGYSMSIAAVPVPAAVWLFGSGLLGLVAVSRRRTR